MADLANPKVAILCSDNFSFLTNPNGYKKDIYTGIVSNMIEAPIKDTLYANQVCAAGLFYDNKTHKLGGGEIMVTTDSR